MIGKHIAGNAHDVEMLRAFTAADPGELIELDITGVEGRRIVIHQVFLSLDDDPAAACAVVFWNGDNDEEKLFDITKGGPVVFMTHFVCDPGNTFYLNLFSDNESVNATAAVIYSLEAA